MLKENGLWITKSVLIFPPNLTVEENTWKTWDTIIPKASILKSSIDAMLDILWFDQSSKYQLLVMSVKE